MLSESAILILNPGKPRDIFRCSRKTKEKSISALALVPLGLVSEGGDIDNPDSNSLTRCVVTSAVPARLQSGPGLSDRAEPELDLALHLASRRDFVPNTVSNYLPKLPHDLSASGSCSSPLSPRPVLPFITRVTP